MPNRSDDETLAKLESNQLELRENIRASEELIARSDELLERYRAEQDEEKGRRR